MKLKSTLCWATIALSLCACETTAQYTSGADYLERYPAQASSSASSSLSASVAAHSKTDAAIREIAAVEPDLHFPARIGLARIHQRELVGVPADEAESWRAAAENLGAGYGEFIPVSPLVAEMISPHNRFSKSSVVEHIRRGAARQHLDYVITYEVTDKAYLCG